jgi:hypothetical protein
MGICTLGLCARRSHDSVPHLFLAYFRLCFPSVSAYIQHLFDDYTASCKFVYAAGSYGPDQHSRRATHANHISLVFFTRSLATHSVRVRARGRRVGTKSTVNQRPLQSTHTHTQNVRTAPAIPHTSRPGRNMFLARAKNNC